MKICEANEQTLGSAKSEPIKFSSLPLSSLLFPSPPFYFLPASRFIRFCRARSRGCTSLYLYVPLSWREKIRDARKILECRLKFRSPERTRVERLLGVDGRIDFAACLHFNWQTVARKRH